MFFSFVLASAYTHPIREYGTSPILGRMVWADVFGFGTIIAVFVQMRPYVNKIAMGALCFLVALLPGVAASSFPERTFLEIAIYAFLVLVFTTGAQVFYTKKDLVNLLRMIAVASITGAVLGAWENSTHFTGLPRLFGEDVRAYRGASFRNSGQAGSYLMVALAALIPFRFGEFGKSLNATDRRLFDVSIATSAICILMTVKIAAYIGISIGAIGFAVHKRKLEFVIPLIIAIFVFQNSFPWIQSKFPTLTNRFNTKVESRLTTAIVTDKNSFLAGNYGKAIEAFVDNPLLGTGIMGFSGRYDQYEVHSTPMKLLGETGLLGCLGYLFFVLILIREYAVLLRYPRNNQYREALVMMVPFLLGCSISWLYTFHIRKREFWIMLVVIVVTLQLMKNCYRNIGESEFLQVHDSVY